MIIVFVAIGVALVSLGLTVRFCGSKKFFWYLARGCRDRPEHKLIYQDTRQPI
jgi:hypothetical protein